MKQFALGTLIVLASTASAQASTWAEFKDAHPLWYQFPAQDETQIRNLLAWVGHVQDGFAARYEAWQAQPEPPAVGTGGPLPPVTYSGDHLALWLCIHDQEGRWDDPNPPYFGGLQMGYGFMEAYGGDLYATKGTADYWTPDEQIGVAEEAWRINGYNVRWLESQWPATAPPCV